VRREAVLALAEVGWANAQAVADGRAITASWDDDQRAREVEKISKRILSALGKEAMRAPRAELVAEALLLINDRFAEQAASSPEVHEAFLSAVRVSFEDDLGWTEDAEGEDEDYDVDPRRTTE
jgi:hypothetical protein